MAAFALLSLAGGAATAQDTDGPSFDCARAATRSEKEICDVPGLPWHDRQLGKAYGIARDALGEAGLPRLKAQQQAFLKAREACMDTGDAYGCIVKLYSRRLSELAEAAGDANFEAGDYEAANGSLWAVRYPDGSVAMSLSTIGGGDHTCTFETDHARARADGAWVFSEKPDTMYAEACTLTAAPNGQSRVVTAQGDGCTYYCGVRASLDGTFVKAAP